MVKTSDIAWFKSNFAGKMAQALEGSVFDVDMLTAIACQETGSLWAPMRQVPSLSPDRVVALCCGDTLDADKGRRAFPRTKADLLAVPRGQQMFDIARSALLDMAEHIPDYRFARTNPKKFSHGFGVFQYDLQFFLTDPDYFIEKKYESFDNALQRAIGELNRGLRKLRLQDRSTITDREFCHVAIAYNTGGFNPAKELKQGHFDGKKFYGESIRDFLAMARTVPTGNAAPARTSSAGAVPLSPPETITATGPSFRVDTNANTVRLRSEPRISNPKTANVKADLPDGHIVRALNGTPVNDFIEVQALLGGKIFQGFAAKHLLSPLGRPPAAAALEATPSSADAALPEAHLAGSPTNITKRTAPAGARSLSEPNMPRRAADNPDGLRTELNAIIDYLANDDPRHKRYQPHDGFTFCNIYAHDYCTLAGAYLPRVWWSQPALLKIALGETLEPRLGSSVDEARANDIYRWLRDFGQTFGWRRAASLSELQDHANLGGISLIVARRKQDGRSGHIVAVVPETGDETAKRNESGAVTMALQSQAGSVNFRRGRSTLDWWKSERFAEHAFWTHP
ncbi:hypothetical protein [Allosphingosinicella deserti]|uniref:SH3b domain-containing protein n=1 Tax=Allosphingosinicella deserti TaxID=2116704 RepID=A0A2P7QSH8_9SPHN|nr:hypothetical protein [Sphingomonas deserti]PSJ40907.1 hypothetical protein C7I55_11580 [Sphingomonas deserti]